MSGSARAFLRYIATCPVDDTASGASLGLLTRRGRTIGRAHRTIRRALVAAGTSLSHAWDIVVWDPHGAPVRNDNHVPDPSRHIWSALGRARS